MAAENVQPKVLTEEMALEIERRDRDGSLIDGLFFAGVLYLIALAVAAVCYVGWMFSVVLSVP